ncbi:MAG: DNA-processing protein DprA [Pseudonocardiaceae bacterium]
MDTLTELELAIGATRHGSGRPKLATRVRLYGLEALHHVLEQMDSRTRSGVRDEAERLADRGVTAILRGSTKYPTLLDLLENAPLALFALGNTSLLGKPGIGVCGSRNASDDGLRAAQTCGQMAAVQGLVSTSGYARGVDMATHVSTLEHGGNTIIVLPEGIQDFKVKRDKISTVWEPSRTLVVSQFSPTQPWTTGGAMTRNNVIIGLSLALVVVEAGETGGTLAAGKRALKIGRRVITLEFARTPRGNSMLVELGAVAVQDKIELGSFLHEIRYVADEPPWPNDTAAQDPLIPGCDVRGTSRVRAGR